MEQKKEKFRLPLRAYLIYLLVASFLFTSVAFSKYIIVGGSEDTARTARFGDVTVTESGDIVSAETSGNVTENSFIIIPGVDLEKSAKLRFEGAETACYVFLQIVPDGWTATDDYAFSAGDGKLAWAVDDGWTYLTVSDGTYVYYTVVAAGDAISGKNVIEGSCVTVSSALTKSELAALPSLLNIKIQGCAVQYDGFGDFAAEAEHALAAWNSVASH